MNKNDMDNEKSGNPATMNQQGGGSQGKGSAKTMSGSQGQATAASSQGQGTGTGSQGQGTQGTGIGSQSQATGTASGAQSRSAGSRAEQAGGEEGVLSQVQESGKDLASKGLQAISDKTRSTTEGYKSEITSGLHTLADGLRQTSSSFRTGGEENALASAGARYIGDLAEKIESVSGYFERKDATELLRDVKGFAQRNPTVFVGGAFAVGFALSRLIRSGASASTRRGGFEGSTRNTGGAGLAMRGGAESSMRGGAADSAMRG